jgi:hypothetical protein
VELHLSLQHDSCMKDLRIDGRVTSVSSAPSSSQLYNYHYPMIMSESMPHNSMQANHKGHDMAFALTSANRYNSSSAKQSTLILSTITSKYGGIGTINTAISVMHLTKICGRYC